MVPRKRRHTKGYVEHFAAQTPLRCYDTGARTFQAAINFRGMIVISKKDRIKLAIRDELLGRFATGRESDDYVLAADWLYDEYLPTLTKKEERALEEVLAEMIGEGMIEHVGGRRPTFRLTAKGQQKLAKG